MPNDDAYLEIKRDDLDDSFRADLEIVMAEVFPVLQQRINRSQFASWHRERGKAFDLAQEAIFRFFKHCGSKRKLPNDPLGYAVAIARNLAKKEIRESKEHLDDITEPFSLAMEEKYPSEPVDEPCDADLPVPPVPDAIVEALRSAMDDLPPRQRQAIELQIEEPSATDRELGARMNIGEDGFRKNCTRGYARLRKSLEAKGIQQSTRRVVR